MHLGSERESELRADTILRDLIVRMREKGYSFITVEETEWSKEKDKDFKGLKD